jgi:ribosome biogenesis GTPase
VQLDDLGWDATFARQFEALVSSGPHRKPQGTIDISPARVAIEFNHVFRVYTERGEFEATTAGRLKHRAGRRSELPAVGDWVAVRKRPAEDQGTIVAVLPRRTWFSRKAAGRVTGEQVVAANVDVAFLVMGLDGDFSTRRLDRYLLLARESGAAPVVVLTKPDLATDLEAQVAEVKTAAGDLPVHLSNPKRGEGIERVATHLPPGRTGALLGSSGVGKSTIINRLMGEDTQRTREVRETDSKGRHTTTHRELVVLPSGGLIIDTPGMRELQLWDVDTAVHETFDDIEVLGASCHFTDCRHREEPRCAAKLAVEEGRLPAHRLESYVKLKKELAALSRQLDARALIDEKRRSRIMGKALKARLKEKRG